MIEFEITCVEQKSTGHGDSRIVQVGIRIGSRNLVLTRGVIRWLIQIGLPFYVLRDDKKAYLQKSGGKGIQTKRDTTTLNNLKNLPPCSEPEQRDEPQHRDKPFQLRISHLKLLRLELLCRLLLVIVSLSVIIIIVKFICNLPPETIITSTPSDPSNSNSATFSFSATEAGSTFECKLDGELFSACTSPKSYSGLSDGSHTFQVQATDPLSNTDATPASYTWMVDTTSNSPPTVTITTPANGSTFIEGEFISFNATVSDPEDGNLTASLVWQSDKDGQIGTGGSFTRSDLSVGLHVITAVVTDSGRLTGTDRVTLTIQPNQPPTVTITTPANGSTFIERQLISFSGTAADPEDGNLTTSLGWRSDKDGQIGTGGSFITNLSVGLHTIAATVTDSGGLTGTVQTDLTVNCNWVNVIANGSFEEPWAYGNGVAPGWSLFDNGDAHFGWYDDTWPKVVFDGKHAQLIEIIADGGVGDRYAGIFQTVDVVPGENYKLVINGLVRSDEGSGPASDFGYVLQYGLDYAGEDDWTRVTEWIDLPFPEHPREDPDANNIYNYGTFETNLIPPANRLTLYLRAWKKWPDLDEGNWNFDGIVLRCCCKP